MNKFKLEESERPLYGIKKTYMTAFDQKNFLIINFLQILSYLILVCIRIRIGSVFNTMLDPDPDSAKYLDPDPDSVNMDPQHWYRYSLCLLLNTGNKF
jgi:hypothetical protein